MGKMPRNSLGKSSELKLHCFCLFDAYSMPKDICSVRTPFEKPSAALSSQSIYLQTYHVILN